MILPTAESLERRRKSYQRRGVVCGVAFVLMVLSAVLPHVTVLAYQGPGGPFARALFPSMRFFVAAVPTSEGFPAGVDRTTLGLGLVVTYLGLALQHLGLLFGVFTFWVLAAEDVGVWTRRCLLFAGIFFTLSAPTVITGYLLIRSTGVPIVTGVAWIFALATGLILAGGALYARRRMDTKWFLTKPELIT